MRVRAGPLRNGRILAALDTVLRASPHRVTPACRHFGPSARGRESESGCGGCTWQHIAYAEQLRLKADLVTRLVRDQLPQAPVALPTIAGADPASPWGYRQKVHFVFGAPSGHAGRARAPRAQAPLIMGHYRRGSRRLVAVRECPVHDPRGNGLAFRFRDACLRTGAQAAPAGTLKSIAVRAAYGTTEMMCTLVVSREGDKMLRAAAKRIIERADAASSMHLNVHPRADAFIFGRDTRKLAGPDRMREQLAGTSFLLSPTAFFQTNVRAAEILVQITLAALPGPGRVLDLYAGAGLFALPLASAGHTVTAVEENRTAVTDGEASRRLNGIPEDQCRFVARSVEEALASSTGRRSFEAVVLDPPREGCSPAVIAAVFGAIRPPRAVYISCNPEALAHDLAVIAAKGYEVRSLQPVDMFPHTAHVESVVVLNRRKV